MFRGRVRLLPEGGSLMPVAGLNIWTMAHPVAPNNNPTQQRDEAEAVRVCAGGGDGVKSWVGGGEACEGGADGDGGNDAPEPMLR
jgi:hypothetical protein